MKLKAMAIAAAAGFSAFGSTASFAANTPDINLGDTATWGNDATALDLPTFVYQSAYTGMASANSGTYVGDVAMILQSGANGLGNTAMIEQYGGYSNFAAIAQDDATASNVGGIFQYGTYNAAVIYQH